MESKRVKTAIELAMEKVAQMPKLDSEEIEEQRRQEYFSHGESIANRYLQNTLRKDKIENELAAFEGEAARIVKSSLLSALKQSLGLQDAESNQRVLEAILTIDAETPFPDLMGELDGIIGEYKQQLQMEYTLLEKKERKRLKHRGISGSAIRPNLLETEDWQNKFEAVRQVYNSKLDAIKERMPS